MLPLRVRESIKFCKSHDKPENQRLLEKVETKHNEGKTNNEDWMKIFNKSCHLCRITCSDCRCNAPFDFSLYCNSCRHTHLDEVSERIHMNRIKHDEYLKKLTEAMNDDNSDVIEERIEEVKELDCDLDDVEEVTYTSRDPFEKGPTLNKYTGDSDNEKEDTEYVKTLKNMSSQLVKICTKYGTYLNNSNNPKRLKRVLSNLRDNVAKMLEDAEESDEEAAN